MQFDVFANPVPRARRAFPYVVVLQADVADTGRDRIVVFLAPLVAMSSVSGRLMPVVRVQNEDYALLLPSLTNLPSRALKTAVANIGMHRDRIIDALDWLFLGI